MKNLAFITLRDGRQFPRRAWTGGDCPANGVRRSNPFYRAIVTAFFRESLRECGGLDLWKCAGTGSLERARIFWNQARLDGWRTFSHAIEGHAANGWQFHYRKP